MKHLLLLLLGFLIGVSNLPAQHLDSLLQVVHDRDQAVRMELIRLSQQIPPPVDSLMAAYIRMQEADAENQRIVSELLDRGGWPIGISDEAAEIIWLVIDHADLKMQRRWMPLIEEQVAADKISKSSYATLLDRMLMRENRPQRYGTQTCSLTHIVEDDSTHMEQRIWLWPVEQPERLDSLRKVMGLAPIATYLREVEEFYGVPCLWDPKLTVEHIEVLQQGD